MPLGILLKDKSEYSEMIDIMDSLHKYIPKKTISSVLQEGNEEFSIVDEKIHQILFGDQKTAARMDLFKGNV